MYTIMPEPRLPAPQGRAGLSHQHESGVVSQGNCGDDVYGTADQQARDCDRSWTGGERGREQPCAARGHRDGDRVGRRHARQVARAHKGREHVAGAPELDAQDGRLGGQKRNARAAAPNGTSSSRLNTTLTGAAAMLDIAICLSRPSGDRMHIATK